MDPLVTGFVVVLGNPFDGMSVHGPFPSIEEANDWGEANGEEWLTVGLYGTDFA